MSDNAVPSLNLIAPPLAWFGRQALGTVEYLGGLAVVVASAFGSLVRRSQAPPRGSFVGQLSWMLGMGLPIVGLVHVGIGSFLSMQSYFGGTFVDGTGAVVGVGLVRNVAPLMACLALAGLLAARITPELRAWRRDREPRPAERVGFLERTADGHAPKPAIVKEPASSVVAARLAAAMVAGLVLSLWGTGVGLVVGWKVGQTMVGVSTFSYFLMFWDMLWLRDVVGLLIKGILYGLFAGIFSCHEGLLGSNDDGFERVAASACRGACLAIVAILVVNSGWFLLVYHAGAPFGPTLMASPAS